MEVGRGSLLTLLTLLVWPSPRFRQEAQVQGPQDPEAGDPPRASAQASPHRPEETAHPEEQGGGVRVRQAAGQEDEGTALDARLVFLNSSVVLKYICNYKLFVHSCNLLPFMTSDVVDVYLLISTSYRRGRRLLPFIRDVCLAINRSCADHVPVYLSPQQEAKDKRQEQIAKRRRLSSLRASTSKSESSQK